MVQTTLISAQDPKVKLCIDACSACGNSCVETMSHCLRMGGKHADPMRITLLANCAELCRTAADFMLSGSEFSSQICDVCSDVCEQTADSCAEIGDDEQVNACADLCRACAASCEDIASM